MSSPQLQDWLLTFDRLEAFMVNPITRPYLESYFTGYQWPTNVREQDARIFLERWEEHWRQISAQMTSSSVTCMFHRHRFILSFSHLLANGQSRTAVLDDQSGCQKHGSSQARPAPLPATHPGFMHKRNCYHLALWRRPYSLYSSYSLRLEPQQ